jgi:adenylylsulfate kinase
MLMILLTGLSGAGKSTLANELCLKLTSINIAAEVIDGDVYRKTLNADLSFSGEDRRENIQRLCRIANDKNKQGVIAIVAAINPFEDLRVELCKQYHAKIVWVSCSLLILAKRDTKGLYRRALLPGDHPEKLWNLTGVNDLYEIPVQADLVIDTSESSVEECSEQLFNYVSNFI